MADCITDVVTMVVFWLVRMVITGLFRHF